MTAAPFCIQNALPRRLSGLVLVLAVLGLLVLTVLGLLILLVLLILTVLLVLVLIILIRHDFSSWSVAPFFSFGGFAALILYPDFLLISAEIHLCLLIFL